MGRARRSRQVREQAQRRARTQRLLIASGVAVVVVAALVIVQQVTSGGGTKAPTPTNLTGIAAVQREFSGLTEVNGTLGAFGARVTIIEYGDLTCPICKAFDNDVAPQIIDDIVRPGTAKFEFRDWPIVGPSSVPAAKAAYAAAQQNKLWRYLALTYLNQGDETTSWFTKPVANALAKAVGMNIAKFDKDSASKAAVQTYNQVNEHATSLSFQGTPTIQVEGPKGSITVDATYDAIVAGVQQVSGG